MADDDEARPAPAAPPARPGQTAGDGCAVRRCGIRPSGWQARIEARQAERVVEASTVSNDTSTKAIRSGASRARPRRRGGAGWLPPARARRALRGAAAQRLATRSGGAPWRSSSARRSAAWCASRASPAVLPRERGTRRLHARAAGFAADECEQVGNPFDDAQQGAARQPIAFANLAATVRQRDGRRDRARARLRAARPAGGRVPARGAGDGGAVERCRAGQQPRRDQHRRAMNPRLVIYGANGYTGRLVARAAAERGLAPVLAGRSRDAVAGLAAELGCESLAFDLSDPARIGAALAGSARRDPLRRPVLGDRRADDGRLPRRARALHRHHRRDRGLRIRVPAGCRRARRRHRRVPGTGFDVVPTDCLAATLAAALPDATRLALGFDSRSGLSRGTAATSVEGLGNGSCVREGGELRRIPLGSRSRRIDFGAGEKLATAIPWAMSARPSAPPASRTSRCTCPFAEGARGPPAARPRRLAAAAQGGPGLPEVAHREARARPGRGGAREVAGVRLGRGGERGRPPRDGAGPGAERLHAHARRRRCDRGAPARGRRACRFHDPARLMGSDFLTRLPGVSQVRLD